MDRFDLRIEVPPVGFTDLDLPPSGDSSATVSARVQQARVVQARRFQDTPGIRQNADIEGNLLDEVAAPDAEGKDLLVKAAERFGLSARAYHRILRVARTIADLEGVPDVRRPHVAEALSYRISARVAA
jgi:magnesium chelatase family protein